MRGESVAELPVEILEHVFSLLSVPELWKLPAVCKRRRELLSKPNFHDYYELHPKRKNDAFLFLTHDLDCYGWSSVTVTFLDLETQRRLSIDAAEYSLKEEDIKMQ